MFKYLLLTITLISLSSCSDMNNSSSTTGKSTSVVQDVQGKEIGKTLYVDVREDDEWAAGHIEGALHVKLGDIESGKFDQIPKDIPVNLYCRSGRRSGIAYDILTKAGYTNITNAGGIEQVPGVKIVR